MRLLKRINTAIAKAERALLVFIVLLMVSLAFLQVILRNVFAHGLLWGDIFLRQMVLWVGFIGASLATREGKHIGIDLFSRMVSGKALTASRLFTNLFASVVSFVLAHAAWNFVAEERSFNSMAFAAVPAWYFESIIPVGFGLMALRFLFIALEQGLMLRRKREDAE